MEFDQIRESKDSSEEEDDRSDSADDGTSTIRSYGCVFCKRGFTTAQALGGHMNIHRKDRAKARPASNSSSSSNFDKNHALLSMYFPFTKHPQHDYPIDEPRSRTGLLSHFPSSGRRARPSSIRNHGGGLHVPYTTHLRNSTEEDWRWGLSLRVGPSSGVDGNREKGQASADRDRIDLELRLGHEH